MKTFTLAAALAATLALASPARAANVDVGVSIDISQPGVYGRIDIGRFPQPQLVLPNPVVIGRPVVVQPEPVYLWVPPGHRRNWKRHCRQYGACGVPVYFVRHDWYDRHVRHDDRREWREERRDDRRDDRREWREERRDDRRDDRRGKGRGRDD
jgi:hypothetical protein